MVAQNPCLCFTPLIQPFEHEVIAGLPTIDSWHSEVNAPDNKCNSHLSLPGGANFWPTQVGMPCVPSFMAYFEVQNPSVQLVATLTGSPTHETPHPLLPATAPVQHHPVQQVYQIITPDSTPSHQRGSALSPVFARGTPDPPPAAPWRSRWYAGTVVLWL